MIKTQVKKKGKNLFVFDEFCATVCQECIFSSLLRNVMWCRFFLNFNFNKRSKRVSDGINKDPSVDQETHGICG